MEAHHIIENCFEILLSKKLLDFLLFLVTMQQQNNIPNVISQVGFGILVKCIEN